MVSCQGWCPTEGGPKAPTLSGSIHQGEGYQKYSVCIFHSCGWLQLYYNAFSVFQTQGRGVVESGYMAPSPRGATVTVLVLLAAFLCAFEASSQPLPLRDYGAAPLLAPSGVAALAQQQSSMLRGNAPADPLTDSDLDNENYADGDAAAQQAGLSTVAPASIYSVDDLPAETLVQGDCVMLSFYNVPTAMMV